MRRSPTPLSDSQVSDHSQPRESTDCPPPFEGLDHGPMHLIPWHAIWHSLRDARIRGQGGMIEVFYETLFRDAVFDDAGAWSQVRSKQNQSQQHRSN